MLWWIRLKHKPKHFSLYKQSNYFNSLKKIWEAEPFCLYIMQKKVNKVIIIKVLLFSSFSVRSDYIPEVKKTACSISLTMNSDKRSDNQFWWTNCAALDWYHGRYEPIPLLFKGMHGPSVHENCQIWCVRYNLTYRSCCEVGTWSQSSSSVDRCWAPWSPERTNEFCLTGNW